MEQLAAKVHLIDDDPKTAESVLGLLESVGIEVVTHQTAQDFLDVYQETSTPVCLLLEVRLRGLSGLELQRRLNQRQAVLPTIFLTEQGDTQLAVQAMKQGAMDYIQKPFHPQNLLDTVHEALEHSVQLSQQRQLEQELQAKISRLTKREQEVLDLVLDGHPSKAIALRFGLSKKTIDLHRAHIMSKLEAKSVPELVRIAIQAGAKD